MTPSDKAALSWCEAKDEGDEECPMIEKTTKAMSKRQRRARNPNGETQAYRLFDLQAVAICHHPRCAGRACGGLPVITWTTHASARPGDTALPDLAARRAIRARRAEVQASFAWLTTPRRIGAFVGFKLSPSWGLLAIYRVDVGP